MLNGLRRTPPKENGLELGLNNNNNGHHKKEAVSPGAHSASSSHSNSSTPAPAPGAHKKSSDEPNGKPATPKSGRSTPPGGGPLEAPPPGHKAGLPGPPYGIPGFPLGPVPPGVSLPPAPTNGHAASNGDRDAYRFNDSVRAPPVGIPPSGKP